MLGGIFIGAFLVIGLEFILIFIAYKKKQKNERINGKEKGDNNGKR